MLKRFLSVISQAVAAARKQVSRRQLIVTAVSAAVMLTALIAFGTYSFFPTAWLHLTQQPLLAVRREGKGARRIPAGRKYGSLRKGH